MSFKSGFVALIGKPNVGKSTLLNSLLSKKVAIATPKPQTTRDNIRGILTLDDSQIVFIDTPGIHKGKQRLNKLMVQHAYNAVSDVDIIVMLMDATKGWEKSDEIIYESISKNDKPKILVINKIDKLTRKELIELLAKVNTERFDDIIPLSALRKNNVDELVKTIKGYLKDEVQYYPSDMISDYPEKFMIAEIIREKILLNTEQEVPHSIAIVIENITLENGVYNISALIITERPTQKAIIIGREGSKLKVIGTQARLELEERLNAKVYLETYVRVEEDWRNKRGKLEQFGYWDKEVDE